MPTERRQDEDLREALERLKLRAERRGHRLHKFEIVSTGGASVVRSKCLLCGDWVRLNRQAGAEESMGPALQNECVITKRSK
jgi:hypothetical protein